MAEGDPGVQCCVVGGGPAGVMAGALLARAGVRVVVLESHADFLRDFRGDTVHPATMDVLDELGWLDGFLSRPHQKVVRLRAHVGDRDVRVADFTHVRSRCRFVALMPQWDFLDFVAQQAAAFAKFELRMNARATDVIHESGRVVGVRGLHEDKPFEIRAGLVLAADGRHSVMRERAGLRVIDRSSPIDVLWFRLRRNDADPADSMGWAVRGRFLVLIHRGAYWQVGFLVRKGGFDEVRRAGIEAFRRELATIVPFLADRTSELASFDDVKLLVVKVDRLERWWTPGMLCIGDAAHAMSPIGGVGINLAIQDAVSAANILSGPLRRGRVRDDDLARVQRRRELPTRATQAVQVRIQDQVLGRVLGSERPTRAGPLLRALDRMPLLQRIPARLIGVGVRPEHVRQG